MSIVSKIFISIIFFFVLGMTAHSQEAVQWKSMNEALRQAEKENKKIFIDVYTDWCSWCKKMDVATFQQPDIAAYINEHFIPVKFNAEQREEILYQGQAFKYVNYGRRGYHQLAAELSKSLGKLSYPTIIFLDEEQNVIQPIPGYQDPKSFEVIMNFIGDDHFRTRPFKSYAASFRGNYN
jgi:thioredoxin-related protein